MKRTIDPGQARSPGAGGAAPPVPGARRWRRRASWALGLWIALRVVVFFVPRPPLSERASSSVAVYDARGQLLRLGLALDQQYRLWIPLERVSPQLQEATLLYEDRHFRWHLGVNPVSLLRAALTTWGGGRRMGGSTISMQLARRLWNLHSSTVPGKLRQIGRALELELLYSKDQILEAYLNLAPYGGNIEGVGAASLICFRKTADQLNLPEALTLAVIPQNPSLRSRQPRAREAARRSLWRTWVSVHPEARADQGLIELPLALHGVAELPFLAPHFVDQVIASSPTPEVHTTLELPLQRLLERHVRAYVSRRGEVGIKNAAVLLVDVRSAEVKALVGSADFHDASIAGQVNGALALRSPGSALKPLVYALGIDQGVIHPETMLRDVPTAFAAYAPENFDGKFAGPLSARQALVRSRNIPALAVAGQLNKPSFYDFLRTAGLSRLLPESHYGLGLVLGNAEVSLEELAMLYATLGHRGLLRPLRWRGDAPRAEGTRVLSEEASFMTLDMLASNPRTDRRLVDGSERHRVAWKTGTSWGFRDAWSVGLFGPYVLGVWVGNFSGEGNPAFVGAQAAAPLFFEIVDSVVAADPRLRPLQLVAPAQAKRVEVCAISGGLPTAHCPHQKKTWFIPGRSPIEPCSVHRMVTIDVRSGRRVCGAPQGPVRSEVFEVWASDMAHLFEVAGLPRRALPPAGPGCEHGESEEGRAPRITSPLRGVTYTLRKGHEAGDRIALSAVTDGGASEVFWFVDDRFIGRARSGTTLFYAPAPGAYQVRAVDDLSRSDARELRVEYAR